MHVACLVTYQWRLIPHLLQENKRRKTKLGQLASLDSVERKKAWLTHVALMPLWAFPREPRIVYQEGL